MKRALVILPIIALAIFVAVAYGILSSSHPEPPKFTSPTRPAPVFDVAGLDGGRVKLSDFKGRPVLVNMWGSYCAPCQLEHPELMKMAAQGVEIVGMLYKDPDPDLAREQLVQRGNPFKAVGIDGQGDLGIAIGISGVPESFLIDAKGEIVKTKRNYFTAEDVPDFVNAYRAEQTKAGVTPASPAAPTPAP